MENTMTLEDMKNLIKSYDCFEDIIDCLRVICDADGYGGKIEGKYFLLDIMKHHTVLDTTDREDGPYSTPFRVILENRDIAPEARAKLLLGL